MGAISEVAASAVNSLTPAPAPAIAIPAELWSALIPEIERVVSREHTDKDIHCVCRAADDHPKTDERGTNNGNITTTDQIRERSDKWTDARETEEIGQDLFGYSEYMRGIV